MMNQNTTDNASPRFYVHTVLQSGVGRAVSEPYWVVDRTTNLPVDQYSSKRAAALDAKDRNAALKADTADATTRTQLRATCPACFAVQAVRSGRLAQHGYTRPQMWQQNVGTCSGAGHQHFGTETGRNYTAQLASKLRTQADERCATAVQVLTGSAPVWGRKRVSSRVYTPVVIENATQRQREEYAHRLTVEATQMHATAAEFDVKVAQWQPVEPVAVRVDATRATLVHFYSAHYRGKACASSMMGAQRGVTTQDATHVTCPKCLARIARIEQAGGAL